jgi:DNA-binding XRE family transcriptional regulator
MRLTQRQLADAFGIQDRTVQKWEAGAVPIKPIVVLAMQRLAQIIDAQRETVE